MSQRRPLRPMRPTTPSPADLFGDAVPRLGEAPRTEAERRYLEAQQRIAAATRAGAPLPPRAAPPHPASAPTRIPTGIPTGVPTGPTAGRSGRLVTRLVAAAIVVTLLGAAAVILLRPAEATDATEAAGDGAPGLDWPVFDEPLVEPASYRTTFRGPSYLSPSPWFEAARGAGTESIVVEIDRDGPGPSPADGMLVRREGAWHLDLQQGIVRSQTSSDGTTWMGFDDATRLRTFSAVTAGPVRDHLVLVDEADDEGPGRRGAHGLHTYVFDFDATAFCDADRFSCDSWFRSFGLSADDPSDTPLTGRMNFRRPTTTGAMGVRARPLAVPAATSASASAAASASAFNGRTEDAGRPSIQTEDTTPDRDAADGRLLLRITVDEDGLLWDIELRRGEGRVFWISLDELSSEPFAPPVVLP